MQYGAVVALWGLAFFATWGVERSLGRSLLMATVRAAGQLLLAGWVLQELLNRNQPGLVVVAGVIMTALAGQVARGRVRRRLSGMYGVMTASLGFTAWLSAGVLSWTLQPEDPWGARTAIPALGIVLGNSLTGLSLAVERFLSEVRLRRDEIETRLSWGMTRFEAIRGLFEESARAALTPVLNAMSAVGVVSLPGVMTGQILAGATPLRAIEDQFLILVLIAVTAICAALLCLVWAVTRVLNPSHQLSLLEEP